MDIMGTNKSRFLDQERKHSDMTGKDLLLVIDFQNVYLPGYDWACPGMDTAVANVCSLLDRWDRGPVIFTQYLPAAEPTGRWAVYNLEYKAINDNPFLSEMVPAIMPYLSKGELITKSTYSSLTVPRIRDIALSCDHVLLSGVVAECCVLSTMMEAIDLGCHTVLLTDCIAGQTPENEAMTAHIANLFAPVHTLVTTSTQIFSC